MRIAICCIAYNRIDSLSRLLSTLNNAVYNESVTLIISIDKSDTNEVEKYADFFKWTHGEKKVIKHEQNLGLRKHILRCGRLLDEFEALIVLEDDIIVSKSFYYYARQCVEKYYYDDSIAGISLYNFPLNYQNRLPFSPLKNDSDIFLIKCAQSWGQIWMRRQWNDFMNWYEKNNNEFDLQDHLPQTICKWPKTSWLKYHTKYCIEENKYFIYPYTSLTTNNSDIGTHVSRKTSFFQAAMLYGEKKIFNLNPIIKYDGFFENENLYDIIGLNEKELCIDFYGEKKNREKRRYWLTTERKNYLIYKSYSLSYRPYEMNIINQAGGNDIYIYDTYSSCNNSFSGVPRQLDYLFSISGKYIKRILINTFKARLLKK